MPIHKHKHRILRGSNYFCGKVIPPAFPWTFCCCPRSHCCFFVFVLTYIFFICRFFLLVGFYLNFPFSYEAQWEMWCELFATFPDHLQPLVSLWLAASRKQCLHQKREGTICSYLAGFKRWKLWLCLTVFVTCLPIPSMLRPTYSAWFLKQILLFLYLNNAVYIIVDCRRSLIILSFLPWLVHAKEFWTNRSQRKSTSPVNCWRHL